MSALFCYRQAVHVFLLQTRRQGSDVARQPGSSSEGALLLLQDLSLSAASRSVKWLECNCSATLALQLLHSVVVEQAGLFIASPEFQAVLLHRVLPSVVGVTNTSNHFSTLLHSFRLLRTVATCVGTSCFQCLSATLPCLTEVIEQGAHMACAAPPAGSPLGQPASTKRNKTSQLGGQAPLHAAAVPAGVIRHRYGAAGARILKGAHRALGDPPTEEGSPSTDTPREDGIVSLEALPVFKLCLALECAGGILCRADVTRSAFAQHDLVAASPARASERQAAPILEPLTRALGQLAVCCFASVPIHSVLLSAAEGPSIQGSGGDPSVADEAAQSIPAAIRDDDEQHEAAMLKFGYMYGRLTPQALQQAWKSFERFAFLDSPEVRPPLQSMLHSLAGFRNAHGVIGVASRPPSAASLKQLSDAMADALAEQSASSDAATIVRRRSSSGGGYDDEVSGHDSPSTGLAGRAGAGAISFTQRMRDMVSGGTSAQRPQEYTAKCPSDIIALDTAAAVGADGVFSLAHALVLALRCLQSVAYACDTQVATAAQRSASKDQAARSAAATALTDKISVNPSTNPELQAAAAAAQSASPDLRVDTTAAAAAPAPGTGVQPIAEMIESVWRPILVSFASTLAVSSDLVLLQSVLRACQSFAASCGSLSLVSARDAFLVGLCNSSMPLWQPTGGFERLLKSAGGLWGRHSASRSARGAVRTAVARVYYLRGQLAEKHAVVFKTLFNMTHCLGNILGRSWLVVLDTVAQFYGFLGRLTGVTAGRRSGAPTQWERLMRAMQDTPTSQLLDGQLFQASSHSLPSSAGLEFQASPRLVSSQAPMGLSGTQFTLSAADPEEEEVTDDMGILFSAMGSLFGATGDLSDTSFQHVLRALMDLSLASLADEAAKSSLEAVHDVGTVMANDKESSLSSGWLSRGQQLVARMRGGAAASASAAKGEAVVFPSPLAPEATQLPASLDQSPLGQGKASASSSTAAAELASPAAAVASPVVQLQALPVSTVVAASPPASPAKGSASRRHIKEGRAVLPPFSLVRLVEVLMYNLHRCAGWWSTVTPILNALAQNPSAKVRQFAVSAHLHLTCAHLSQQESAGSTVLHMQLLEPAAVFLACPFPETRSLATASLTFLVQACGRQLSLPSQAGQCSLQDGVRWSSAGWSNLLYLLVRAVDSCAGHAAAVDAAALLPDTSRTDTSASADTVAVGGTFPGASTLQCSMARISATCDDPHATSIGKRVGAAVVPAIGRLANQICDEHLSTLDAETICHVVIVLTALSRQSVDVNTALTATATLWTITDVVGRIMAAAQQSDDPSHVPSSHTVLRGQPMDLIWDLWRVLALSLRFVVCTDSRSDSAASPAHFAGLGLFSPAAAINATSSIRYDVRNAAVQTLFNSLSSHGSSMPSAVLQELLSTVCLPLAYDVTLRANWYASSEHQHTFVSGGDTVASPGLSVKGEVLGMSNGQAVHARVHHSGDSLVKQWNDARIMALQGITKVIAASFDNIVVLDWFHDVFSFVLALVERAVTGRRLQARSSVRTTSTSSADEGHTQRIQVDSSKEAPSWWDYLLGDGGDDSEEEGQSPAATGGTTTPARRTSAHTQSTADGLLLEPEGVSVAAIACLQELALLVCVPAGVAVDVAADGYAVGMRVIDGALVHTDGMRESDAAKGRTPAQAAATAVSATGHTKHVARSVLWADVFATLNAVIDSHAIVADGSDKVAVAAVTCIQQVLAAYSPSTDLLTDDDKPLPDTFMLSARFSSVIQMLVTVAKRRLSARWSRANSAVGGEAGEEAIPEDLQSPRVEVALGSERAIVKALDRVSHILHGHCCTLWSDLPSAARENAVPSRLLLSCRGGSAAELGFGGIVQQAVASASADYLSALICVSSVRESQCFSPLSHMGHVALLPGALQFAAMGQLLNVLRNADRPYIPRSVREQLSAEILSVLTAASAWYRSMLSQLQGHLEAGDKPVQAQIPPSLGEIIAGMGRTLEDFGMSQDHASAAEVASFLFPLQVWGMGAGGSYSTSKAIVTDGRKAQRFLKKVLSHEQLISDCLVAFAEWAVGGPAEAPAAPDGDVALSRLREQSRSWNLRDPAPQGKGSPRAASATAAAAAGSSGATPAHVERSSGRSLRSLQSMLGVPHAPQHKTAVQSLRSPIDAGITPMQPMTGTEGACSVNLATAQQLLKGSAPAGASDPSVGMVTAVVAAAVKDDLVDSDSQWHLVYVLAAASLSPAGILSGLSVTPRQLDAALACCVGLARLCALADVDVASVCLELLLQRSAMFAATGCFVLPCVLEAALHGVEAASGRVSCPARDGFMLLAVLLQAGADRTATAGLSRALATCLLKSE